MRVLGDKPLGTYSDDEVTHWIQTLLQLPARYGSLRQFKDIPDLSKIIDKNKQVQSATLTQRTVQKKHIDVLKTFYNVAVTKKSVGHNPIEGHDIMSSTAKKKGTGRSFKAAELRMIFSRENYDRYCPQPADWFVPLLALFTGARLNELCQMEIDDVCLNEDIPFFYLRGELKTETSERIIPIHSIILANGFIDYVEDVKQLGHTRVFPYLMYDAKNGYGARVSERFSEYLKKLGIKENTISMHSFRYNFDDGLKHMGDCAEDQRAPLTGHSHRSVSEDVYTSKTTLPEKLQRIERLKYPDVDFSAIKYQSGQFTGVLKREMRETQRRIANKKAAMQK